MNNILSYGLNIQAWIELFSIFIITLAGFWWAKAILRVVRLKRKKLSTAFYVRGIIFCMCAVFLFFAFGSPIKPTIEEQFLSNLYFQYELYPQKAYQYYLTKKASYIQLEKFTEEEKELFEIAFNRKLDQKTFLSLFRMLEKIQKRGRFK